MRVLVVGAGVGGLATARGLVAAGHRVRVFEKAPSLRTAGAAVTLWSNGSGILAALGVGLEGSGSPIHLLERRAATGRSVLRLDLGHAVRRYGHGQVCLPRRDLVGLLAEGLPDGAVEFGRTCEAVAHDRDGVRVEFADGGFAEGDLLVGADGRHSVVRAHLWGADPARPSGWTTLQGLGRIPIDVVGGTTGVHIAGPEGTCGLLPAGDGLLLWWFDVRRGPEAVKADALRRRFGHWAAPVPQVLEAITEVEEFAHHGHRVPRVWGRGRCTLVGDAAHTMPPAQAQGANQALEDAWALVAALRDVTDPSSALRRYERRRSVRASRAARAANTEATNALLPFLSLVPEGLAARAHTLWLRSVSDYLAAHS
ncbi:NAD(P)/FAD-dependent oxidoreductase [Actinocorallia sp. A-T 12471]|uniref:FAD-dependent oxidoreductase n=1 Tax=Actinocorallia sp. A-T 12471 TaxID=3089813 RepID=UPI0029CEED87|nr:NAD(P)/FAD-dependent oxidoreductase [Actinocorallia sp. A-T 12471]MDX6741387.1 NAD(P)/FAD-dependent oxidoreductase [Actinocorallia sp. A-T 12471]